MSGTSIITVVGGDLFHIAAQQLGDAAQWIRIAQLNGLSDPFLSGVTTLQLPAQDPAAGGGIAQQ
jgi:L-ascorbate metabolism protein UlaG (beta-lactamase superfamily)